MSDCVNSPAGSSGNTVSLSLLAPDLVLLGGRVCGPLIADEVDPLAITADTTINGTQQSAVSEQETCYHCTHNNQR